MQGVILAIGAPLGWLLIQRLRGTSALVEISTQAPLYMYMLIGTMVVFALFGFLLGQREGELIESNRRLEDLAVTDSLTGLRNARYFHARLAEELANQARTGEPLSLVIIDLDYFKSVNDEYGHLTGDDVLANAARVISSVTRHSETAARVGGEEFALLLPGSDAEAALDAAERVRLAVGAMRTPSRGDAGEVVRVTASAGVASSAGMPGAATADLYRAADEALYRAKAEGRNRTAVSRLSCSRTAGDFNAVV